MPSSDIFSELRKTMGPLVERSKYPGTEILFAEIDAGIAARDYVRTKKHLQTLLDECGNLSVTDRNAIVTSLRLLERSLDVRSVADTPDSKHRGTRAAPDSSIRFTDPRLIALIIGGCALIAVGLVFDEPRPVIIGAISLIGCLAIVCQQVWDTWRP